MLYRKGIFWKKKRFELFERHLYQNGKVENMSVVAGLHVYYFLYSQPKELLALKVFKIFTQELFWFRFYAKIVYIG